MNWPQKTRTPGIVRAKVRVFYLCDCNCCPNRNLNNIECLRICMFFSCSEQEFQNACNSAGIFDETSSFL